MVQINLYLLGAVLFLNLLILGLVAMIVLRFQRINLGSKLSQISNTRFKGRIAKNVEKEASARVAELIKVFSESLEQYSKKHFEAVSETTLKYSRELAAFMKQQEETIAKESQYLTATNVLKMEKEMEAVKAKRIEELEQKIGIIVSEVSKQVLGRALDLKTHQQLVMEALEKAKAENLFADEPK